MPFSEKKKLFFVFGEYGALFDGWAAGERPECRPTSDSRVGEIFFFKVLDLKDNR